MATLWSCFSVLARQGHEIRAAPFSDTQGRVLEYEQNLSSFYNGEFKTMDLNTKTPDKSFLCFWIFLNSALACRPYTSPSLDSRKRSYSDAVYKAILMLGFDDHLVPCLLPIAAACIATKHESIRRWLCSNQSVLIRHFLFNGGEGKGF